MSRKKGGRCYRLGFTSFQQGVNLCTSWCLRHAKLLLRERPFSFLLRTHFVGERCRRFHSPWQFLAAHDGRKDHGWPGFLRR